MSHLCELTGKSFQNGNKVSHANNKTKRRFFLNLCKISLMSEVLGNRYRFYISANTLRSIDQYGGLDSFLLKSENKNLSKKAQLIKRCIKKKNKKNIHKS